MTKIFEPLFDGFTDTADIARQFETDIGDIDVIVAVYWYGSYEGDAIVVYKQDGEYYEAHGSHCSCYGLEGQWGGEPIVLKELLNRPSYVGYSDNSQINEAIRAKLREYFLP